MSLQKDSADGALSSPCRHRAAMLLIIRPADLILYNNSTGDEVNKAARWDQGHGESAKH